MLRIIIYFLKNSKTKKLIIFYYLRLRMDNDIELRRTNSISKVFMRSYIDNWLNDKQEDLQIRK